MYRGGYPDQDLSQDCRPASGAEYQIEVEMLWQRRPPGSLRSEIIVRQDGTWFGRAHLNTEVLDYLDQAVL